MKTNIMPAIRLTLVCLVLFSGIYTCVIWAVAQMAPNRGEGEIITENGHKYYAQVGQSFTADRYFQSRPSAVGYNAAGSGGSNKGPSNAAYLAEVQGRIDTILVHNIGLAQSAIPADMVTASGSGLDPHISVAGARMQVPRIARLRGLPEADLQKLVDEHTEQACWGMLGPQYVHVLKLNLALDHISH